eukprot:1352914-Amorphochlora_amoeboformis.AAC.3
MGHHFNQNSNSNPNPNKRDKPAQHPGEDVSEEELETKLKNMRERFGFDDEQIERLRYEMTPLTPDQRERERLRASLGARKKYVEDPEGPNSRGTIREKVARARL